MVAKNAGMPATPADLINVDEVIGKYYDVVPDPNVPEQRVSFGTSGHRGSSLKTSFNEAHIVAITQAIAEQMGFDANTLLELGREADYAAFSGGDVTQEHAERYWHDIAEERKFMLGSLPTFRRWRAKLSLADVFHFRKIRLRKIGVKGRDS